MTIVVASIPSQSVAPAADLRHVQVQLNDLQSGALFSVSPASLERRADSDTPLAAGIAKATDAKGEKKKLWTSLGELSQRSIVVSSRWRSERLESRFSA